MNESSEIVVADLPFTVRRIARWSDCDPAGVVFTGRFTDYLLGAVMHFYRRIGYGAGGQEGRESGVGLPCKHMSLTFHASLYPEDVVDIRVEVGEIRTRTFDLVARAFLADGRLAFEGKFTPIAIREGVRESIEIPSTLRAALEPYLTSKEPA
ncbi:acyl-CoA thioesterase [Burkholderia sp. Ac-20384]|uniref:thioesterase family protein n=1 Tax=Burkholderia sp. Ac-20384 TaxID=2703902 RepID=UPI001980DFDF|nr:acyl-CoA thioesterase [Burkholderia sp. Ac-20384]